MSQPWRRKNGITWIRYSLVVFVVVFVWVQLAFPSLNTPAASTEVNDSAAALLSMVPAVLHKFLAPIPKNSSSTLNGKLDPVLTVQEIKRIIAQYNLQQTIINENLFEPISNDSIVIVVQVHNRISYLRHLIISLAQAPGISQALVVFSHDYYDEEINALIQSIDFCKVMQMFYPYTLQLHQHEFPGEDPNDCPRDIKKEQALIRKCNNAMYPDLYGHYREAKFTQTKHHWWWKANRVFGQLDATKNHSGLFLFLEEDHYVAEDFIHMLRLMERTQRESCRSCNILSLGTYVKSYSYLGESKKVEISPWISSKHNMGFAFNRSTWAQIVECSSYFCKYDDYNWDWSLQHVSQHCMHHKLHVMVSRAPRVFHTGECGIHHKKNNCESAGIISKVQQTLKAAKRHLYPDKLTLTFSTTMAKNKLRKGNGGWGDIRDHKLCAGLTIQL